jgi:hypothetical protein
MGTFITKGQIGSLAVQPDWTIENDGYGLLTSRLTFVGDASAAGSAPQKKAAHPEDNRLQCHKTQTTIIAGKRCVVVADYVGLASGVQTEYQWSFNVGGGAEPIQAHPYFSAKKEPTTNKTFREMGWNEETGRFDDVAAAEYGMQGIRSYIAPQYTLGLTFYTSDKDTVKQNLESVGQISATIKGATDLVIPGKYEPVSGYHSMPILITSCGYDMYAHLYKVTAQCRIATGMWNRLVYKAVGS